MNTPIALALLALVTFGLGDFIYKIAGSNQAYGPSYMLVYALFIGILAIVMHIIDRHSLDLSPQMTGLAALGGIITGTGLFAILLAFRLGGHGSIIFPIAGLSVIVSVPLSFIVFREPLTATKLLGFGLGVSSIIVLSR